MKIYDCFMFFDEEMLLDLRLNILNKYVDKFIITESIYTHSGRPKKLLFDINKFSKFKDKIIYKIIDINPRNIEEINEHDNIEIKNRKLINNSVKRENFQRDFPNKLLGELNDEDIIIINDIDEIPKLDNTDLRNINNQIVIFKQKIFYYKFNLQYKNFIWHGSRACKKKSFISPQWLRNIKHTKYPAWRLDTLLSNKKYTNISYIEDGGWHFTNIKSPEDLEKKFKNFLHHQEFEASKLQLSDIRQMIKNRKILYDLGADQRNYKWGGLKDLSKINNIELPRYLVNNYNKFFDWFDDDI